MDAIDATVDRIAALRVAIDAPVVAGIGGEPPPTKPVRRIGPHGVATPGAANRRAVLARGLWLGHRRYTPLPPQEAEQRVVIVERNPGARMYGAGKLAIGCLSPERKQKIREPPIDLSGCT